MEKTGTGNDENAKVKEQLTKLDKSLKELLQTCKSSFANHDMSENYIQQYNAIMVNYQKKLQNIEAERRLTSKAASFFQKTATSTTTKDGKQWSMQPNGSWKKATLTLLRARSVSQTRNLAHQGSPKELLAQLDRLGIDQNKLNISFKKVYEEKVKQKDKHDDGLNTQSAIVSAAPGVSRAGFRHTTRRVVGTSWHGSQFHHGLRCLVHSGLGLALHEEVAPGEKNEYEHGRPKLDAGRGAGRHATLHTFRPPSSSHRTSPRALARFSDASAA